MEAGQRRFCLHCTLVTCPTLTVAANFPGQKKAKMDLSKPKMALHSQSIPVKNHIPETPLGRWRVEEK